jgi:hypothetical protein
MSPNWCENKLYVEGAQEELVRFQKAAVGKTRHGEEQILNEENFIPYPEEYKKLDAERARLEVVYNQKMKDDGFEEMSDEKKEEWNKENPHPINLMKDGFNSGGFEWCVANWGTKWGFCSPKLEYEDEECLEYHFDTAWSPPIPLVKKMGEMFPKLKFILKYWEPGMNFEGRYVMDGGKLSEDMSREML